MHLSEAQIQKHLANEYPDYETSIASFRLLPENKKGFDLFQSVSTEWDYHPNGALKGLNKPAITSIIAGLNLETSAETYQQLLIIERVIKNHVFKHSKAQEQ